MCRNLVQQFLELKTQKYFSHFRGFLLDRNPEQDSGSVDIGVSEPLLDSGLAWFPTDIATGPLPCPNSKALLVPCKAHSRLVYLSVRG
jgi:hypothetical protein